MTAKDWLEKHRPELINRGLDEAVAELDAIVSPPADVKPAGKGRKRGADDAA